MRRPTLWLVLAALLVTAQFVAAQLVGADDGDAVKRAIAGYKTWKPTTNAPVFLPDSTLSLCRAATAGTSDGRLTPHEARHVFVYVNPTGRDAYDRKASLPDGTVIVKEKRLKPEDGKNVELGIMIKHGTSWEYSYVDAAGKTAGGEQLLHCARCHARATNDSVFGRPQAAAAPNGTPAPSGANTNDNGSRLPLGASPRLEYSDSHTR